MAWPVELSRAFAGDATSDHDTQLQEVVVTAQKKSERLQDVPVPVSVISAEALVESNQVKLTDYYSQVPGLSVAPGTISSQTLSIRGVTTGAVSTGPPGPSPTVGITVDDIPFGGSGGADTYVPDFDPGDLSRIEVLRGPQGALYGASSMGGLIKFVTLDPSTAGVTGQIEAGTSSIYNGAEPGSNFRGSVNVPLGGDFAIRASAFTRQDPGYIDNPVLHINGINEDRANGGHLVALWQPSVSVALKVSALIQDIKGGGTSDVTPNPPASVGVTALGELQQYYINGVGPYDRRAQVYSAVLTDKIGSADLVSLTGYNAYSVHDEIDLTSETTPFTQQYFGVIGSPVFNSVDIHRFTQEMRLSAPLGMYFEGLLGGFYSYENEKFQQILLASNPTTGAIVGHWLTLNAYDAPITLTEEAAFGDLTWHVSDRFDIQFGGRESRIDSAYQAQTSFGLYYTVFVGQSSDVSVYPEERFRHGTFTYLITPEFKFSSDLMLYARLASGYRAGGNNFGTPDVPTQYGSDKNEDYDIGMKGDFLNHTFSVDISTYYINWQNLQLPLANPQSGFSYIGNAAAATSKGIEFSMVLKPVANLTISAWIALNDAELTENVPGAGQNGEIFGLAGDKLPYSPKLSGNLSLNKEFPLASETSLVIGGTESYVGSRQDVFSPVSPNRQYLPPFARTDLRGGIRYDTWTVDLYVNNATNRQGLISGGIANTIPYSFYYIQPRTAGLSIARAF